MDWFERFSSHSDSPMHAIEQAESTWSQGLLRRNSNLPSLRCSRRADDSMGWENLDHPSLGRPRHSRPGYSKRRGLPVSWMARQACRFSGLAARTVTMSQ